MSTGLPSGAYEFLRSKILSGELPPQSRIKEQEVAAQLGVSRTPVREALARLESEGLIHSSPRRGAVVRQIELDEIDETYEIRAALERLVSKRACERATDSEIDEMDRELISAEKEQAEGHRSAVLEHAVQFHALLNRSSRSPRLIAMLRSLGERLRVFRNRSMYQPGRAEAAMRQHRAILEALRRRDVREMQRWVEEHAERGRLSAVKAHLEAAREQRMED